MTNDSGLHSVAMIRLWWDDLRQPPAGTTMYDVTKVKRESETRIWPLYANRLIVIVSGLIAQIVFAEILIAIWCKIGFLSDVNAIYYSQTNYA